ncbi:MAG TPA: cellulase family glycosylhydrolase [Gemmatirosa sp.]
MMRHLQLTALRPTRRGSLRPLGAAVVLLFAAVRLGAQGSAPDRRLGLITHDLDARSISLLRAANVRHVKTTLYWKLWQSDPAYPARFAAGIQQLAAAGFEITVVVHEPPVGSSYATRVQVYRDYAAFVGDRARQFPQVTNWQLWNEQDAGWTDVFGWHAVSFTEQGRNYAAMLQLATPRIRQANPRARVVVGGLAGDSLVPFVNGIYAGQGPFDVMAVHAYGIPIAIAARGRGTLVRTAMRAHGDARPMWLTEFGVDSANLRAAYRMTAPGRWDAEQQKEWADLATGNDATGLYARMIGYVLFDHTNYGFGIVRADGASTRPAYAWLQQRNR